MPSTPLTSTQSQSEPERVAREVVPGIWQFTVPIPFPMKTVNMYALVGQHGWVLIDTAIGTPEVRTAIRQGLAQAGLEISRLQAIVLTHNHPDHIGLAGSFYRRMRVPIYMHPIDAEQMHAIWGEGRFQQAKQILTFFSQHGLEPTEPWYVRLPEDALQSVLDLPPYSALVPVEDNQVLELAGEHYRVIWTPGHSDGQICLFRARDALLISADHVLPRITPHIGLYTFDKQYDPLGDYIASLRKIATVPAQLVLPGHGDLFTTLQARSTEIIGHHEQRLQQILELLAVQPQQANQLMQQLFKNRLRDDESHRLALAEVLAHLEYLRIKDQVKRSHTESGILYSIVSSTTEQTA